MFITVLEITNDLLEVVGRKKKAERLAAAFGEGQVVRIDVGTVIIPLAIYDYLNLLGVWVALGEGAKKYAELKKLRVV